MTNFQKVTIHQYHHSTSGGDAVTNHMRLIRDCLSDIGIFGDIFSSESKAPESFGIQSFYASRNRLWKADLILVHHSHGNPSLDELMRIEIPKAMIFHNITPSAFFPHDPYLAGLSDSGRRQLDVFRNQMTATFAVSKFNARELSRDGFENVRLFPLLDLESDKAAVKNIRPAKNGDAPRRLLFVGKLAFHKNQALLLETLFHLEHALPGKYRLVLVGGEDPVYGAYLRDLTRVLGIAHAVEFLGKISQSALEKEYLDAEALVCVSQHEGFCVPLVEAMQHDLPIFAIPIAGVRETLGASGVRLTTRKPHRIAAALSATIDHPSALGEVIRGQRRRLKTMQKTQSRHRIQALCQDIVEELRHPSRRPRGTSATGSFFSWFVRRSSPELTT